MYEDRGKVAGSPIAKYWDNEANGDMSPSDVTCGSGVKCWWRCEKGHRFQRSPLSAMRRADAVLDGGTICPYCNGHAILKGFNDLASLRPDVAKLWDDDVNGAEGLHADEIGISSTKRVHWKCGNGHRWIQRISSRMRMEHPDWCPACHDVDKVLVRGENDLATVRPDLAAIWDHDANNGLEPSDVLPSSGRMVTWRCPQGHTWRTKVSAAYADCLVCKGKRIVAGYNDFATVCPDLAKDWDDAANGPIPEDLSPKSTTIVRWKCHVCGYRWSRSIYDRNVRNNGCVVCNGRRSTRHGSLSRERPDKAAYWDDDANGDLKPDMVTAMSNRTVSWVCQKGHKWMMQVSVMSCRKANCPVCEGHKVLAGYNDLATLHPELMKEWDYSRNTIDPTVTAEKSNRKVWWKCPKGHSWQAIVSTRSNGYGCPVCAGRYVREGVNDFGCNADESLLAEWDDDGNKGMDPHAISSYSNRIVSWKCRKCGNVWKARVSNRMRGTGCPACSSVGLGIRTGFNDLASQYPDVAAEWDYERNGDLTPDGIRSISNRYVWWVCPKGHHWRCKACGRTLSGSGCPYCSGRVASPGESDLETLYPGLMLDWDRDLNTVDPATLRPGSEVGVHWRCHVCGYRWESGLSHRTGTRPHGCPKCMRGMQTSRGERELADFCASLVGEDNVVRNDRTVLSSADNGVRRELDVWVPSRMVAVEFNGVHWHTEALRGRTCHHDKYEECRGLGIRLVQVWDDDWVRRRPVVEDHLRTVLGCGADRRVDARRCRVVGDVPVDCMRVFMEANHIQGYGSGSVRFALMDGDVMVAGLVGSLSAGVLDVVRYATPLGVLVRGGFSRLLSHAVKATGVSHVVTFSDNMVSDGGLYRCTGFHEERVLPPDYSYVRPDEGVRMHKFRFRISRFRSDPGLLYRPGLTESQLATMNGLERVYDAGKVRWGMDV